MDAFDADVLIYAAVPGHPIGRRILRLLPDEPTTSSETPTLIGSIMLIPELLTKPTRERADAEVEALSGLLSRIDLLPVDEATAELAVALGSTYRLKALDAVHLATAVGAGADRFLTTNERDYPRAIAEIDVTYPAELADPE